MKTVRLCYSIAMFAITSNLFASPVHVNGYQRKDGTYVAPHYRSSPNNTVNDNWSTEGNINPYTGKEGTKPRDGAYNNSYSAPKYNSNSHDNANTNDNYNPSSK